MPRTHWLLAAAAVLPLLVPSNALSFPPGLEATKISSAKVCGADECREVSDPKAATALAVGPLPRGTDAPKRGLPWYKGTLTIPAEHGGKVFKVSVTVVPSAGLMRWENRDKAVGLWWVLPSEAKAEYAKLTAGLKSRPARTLPGPRVFPVEKPPSAATPASASDSSNVWIIALGGGVLAALMAGLLLWIRHRRESTRPATPV
jgi:LPXTG-motif cell wall-anchored protein